jgi:chemotaxis protein CheD
MPNMGNPTLPPPRAFLRPTDAPYVFVSVADVRHSKAPTAVIATLGLGSCLGITCYDPMRKIGDLLHVMLPDSQKHRPENPIAAMYLDLGLPVLIDGATRLGSDIRSLELKVFGGAQILQSNQYFSIGRQNVESMRQLALRYQLRVTHWEVGGQFNRSIELYLRDGRVLLRTPGRTETWI